MGKGEERKMGTGIIRRGDRERGREICMAEREDERKKEE